MDSGQNTDPYLLALERDMNSQRDSISLKLELPAPTAWPLVLAFGVTLLCAGLLTSIYISALGVILTVAAWVGWFCDIFPRERHEEVLTTFSPARIVTQQPEVARLDMAPSIHRAHLPIEIYPVSAGVKGGLTGSVAMALLACIYGLVAHHSIWYPINLLASVVYAQPLQVSAEQLSRFHPELLLVATALHAVTSVLVGLLYGVTLPMFPRRPILLGGLLAPLMWSGLLHSSLGIINPLLNREIDWTWFVASQIGFGIVAGLVVVRQQRVRTRQDMPFLVLAGVEAPGIMDEKGGRSEGQ